MNIQNATQFKNFVNNHQLRGLHTVIDAAATCVTQYEKVHTCCSKENPKTTEMHCNSLYQQAVGIIMTSYKAHFLQHVPDAGITFSLHGRTIGLIRR